MHSRLPEVGASFVALAAEYLTVETVERNRNPTVRGRSQAIGEGATFPSEARRARSTIWCAVSLFYICDDSSTDDFRFVRWFLFLNFFTSVDRSGRVITLAMAESP